MADLEHAKEIKRLQEQLKAYKKSHPNANSVALHYRKGHSNTTRSKAYKKNSYQLDCGALDRVLKIDVQNRIAHVQPRVTMEALVKTTLSHGLIAPVIPEFKGITVGGAIMGGAGESTSHRFGIFNDTCSCFEILCGDGSILKTNPSENADLFFGLAGSYGSLGTLLSAEIPLIPAKKYVHLKYRFFDGAIEAFEAIHVLTHSSAAPEFLDGIVFAKDLAVVIEGNMQDTKNAPFFSTTKEWYVSHIKKMAVEKYYEETMSLTDYLFRYDKGAFWMGSYLFKPSLLTRLIGQGIFSFSKPSQNWFTTKEIQQFHLSSPPSRLLQTLSSFFMNSQNLWKILHKAEKWVNDRFIIQDFCLPASKAYVFFKEVLEEPGTFPLWLCPIKGTREPELFAPHYLSNTHPDTHYINIGIYGLPAYSASLENILRKLEQKTIAYRGRKVLYSRNFYTPDEFWSIYPREDYEKLRKKTASDGTWRCITEKVLSE